MPQIISLTFDKFDLFFIKPEIKTPQSVLPYKKYVFQLPFFSLFQIELINASLLDNLEKLLAGLKVINLSLHGFAKPLKVLLCNFSLT